MKLFHHVDGRVRHLNTRRRDALWEGDKPAEAV